MLEIFSNEEAVWAFWKQVAVV